MGCRYLVLTCLLVGLTVAPPPGAPHRGPPSGSPPPGGPHHGPGGKHPEPGGPGDSYDNGVSSGSLNNEMEISGQPNQQQEHYGFEGPQHGAQNQGQDFYQSSFKPQNGINSQQPQGIYAPNSQQTQAYLQQNPAFLKQNQEYQANLKQKLGQKPSASGFAQQIPSETSWAQEIPIGASWGQGQQKVQQNQQLGSYSGSFPGYGYSGSPSFNGYMPQSTTGGGMGYLPGMYNNLPMVIAPPHAFTPFSTGYGMGTGGYGMPQVYGGQSYPQGSQGYAVGPASSSQGQNQFAQGQMTPNSPGAQFYNPVSPMPSQKSTQDVPQPAGK